MTPDDRDETGLHHLDLWLSNDQPIYQRGYALLAQHKDAERLKVWVGDVLYGNQAVHTALCRNTEGYAPHTRYADASWDLLKDTRTKVSRVVFERIPAQRIAAALDGDNELGWEKDHGEQ